MTETDLLLATAGDEQHPGTVVHVRAGAPAAVSAGVATGPACLASHPRLPRLFAVGGVREGVLDHFSYGESLRLLGSSGTGGAEPCHVAVDPSGELLVVVNYASGSLTVVGLDDAGVPGEQRQLVQLEGSGPVPDRQTSAHPHQAVFSPDGDHVLVPDLGADVVRLFRVDRPSRRLQAAGLLAVPAGTGPRHAVVTGTGSVVVTGELSQTVLRGQVDWAAAELTGWHVVPSTRRATGGPNHPGDIVHDEEHGIVHVANRGLDTVSSYSLASGGLEPMSEIRAGGRWPQHLAVVGGALLVAARDSDAVVRLEVDPVTGAVDGAEPRTVLDVRRPVWLLASGRHVPAPAG